MKFEAFGPVAPYIRQNIKMGNAIMNRRSVLKYAGISGFGLAAGSSLALAFEIAKTDAEWKELLTPEQFACAGCGLPLYASDAKYDSGTGWPSFFAALPNAVGEKEDDTLFTKRTEVHCSRCGGHLGHVFNDGPEPTGLRYCMNGVALKFVPA
jgi:peptide-methionine (R)-S-oxide reductase